MSSKLDELSSIVIIFPDSIPLEDLKQKIKSIETEIKNSIDDFNVIEGDININEHNKKNKENNICFEFVTQAKSRRNFTDEQVLAKFLQMLIDKISQLGLSIKRVERWKDGVDINK